MTKKEIMGALYSNAETVWAEYHTRQSKSASVVYEETEYVMFAEDKPILEEVQRRLEMSEWHTGTPTEGGLFLVHLKSGEYDIFYFNDGYNSWDIGFRDVVKWQRIEPCKEENNGTRT